MKLKKWTKEEDAFLEENYSTMTITELLSHFSERSRSSINHRISRLGLRSKRGSINCWTKEEDQFLKENYLDLSDKELVEQLGRSLDGVRYRMSKLNLERPTKMKRWTPEEDEYALTNFGSIKLSSIARNLGRSQRAVEARLNRLGVFGGKLNTAWYTVYDLADALCVDNHTVYKWINDHDMPFKKSFVKTRSFILINPENFWIWAEKNKSLINWSRVPVGSIIPEPDWVKERRVQDRENIPGRSQQYWTKEEDDLLMYLYYQEGLTQEQVSLRLNRSTKAVQRRISRLVSQRINSAKKEKVVC